MPRLRDNVRQIREKSDKRWLIAQGFQPLGPGDDPAEAKQIELPSQFFVEAKNQSFDLFLTAEECTDLGSNIVTVRKRSSVNTEVFHAPHVLVTRGFSNVAFLDFPASFRSSVRGIVGPDTDQDLLAFLAAFLRSDVARFYLFHTSSNWGITRSEVRDDELLRLPFPFPDSPGQSAITSKIAKCIRAAALEPENPLADRSVIVGKATCQISPLIDEYFGITSSERDLINDTIGMVIPSTRPTRSRLNVPTVKQSAATQRDAFVSRVCGLLNGWSKRSGGGVRGQVIASEDAGLAVAILERVDRSLVSMPMPEEPMSIVGILGRLREIATKRRAALEFVRGVKVFDDDRLYIVKSLDQRNWTLTAAMNDADEIAGSLLMRRSEQPA
ncbi:hypothetical protein LOC71_23225 [Rhodopirellula sp. JC740]|uniref:Uncharacterized protein n=1 Tax=Rhodopirellula halodulae TaxID=2894198 RepID=A0ABS8NNW8_9BACT|nr:hypothetical protein [Rhodopirellula sp. JC740]